MSRPAIPTEEKRREGQMLRGFFTQAQAREPSLTQEKLIDEMGLKSQALFAQWLGGRTRISDANLVWLGKRLSFDPLEIRPSLTRYFDNDASSRENQILNRYRTDRSFRAAVDAIAEMSPFYHRNIAEEGGEPPPSDGRPSSGKKK